jgi:hypothetical protein
MRLLSMITMLVVLGMIIYRAADPATWAWLAGDQQHPAPRHAAVAAPTAVQQPETIIPGPTDEDVEEWEAAEEQFQAVTDGSIELAREEMPSYWRLFSWAEHQSLAQLQQRASKNVVLNQFLRDPDEHRGKLFQVHLNVRRVLAYEAPANSAGIKKVYEVWGWSDESKAWLYAVLTAHLPEGMPVGPDVYERAAFTGYFYKVQGYHHAGAAPQDKPLRAPLLIGRLSWRPSELRAAQARGNDWSWLWWLVAIAAVFGVLRMGLWLYGRRKPAVHRTADAELDNSPSGSNLRSWLADAEGDGDAHAFAKREGAARCNGASQPARPLPDFHNN